MEHPSQYQKPDSYTSANSHGAETGTGTAAAWLLLAANVLALQDGSEGAL